MTVPAGAWSRRGIRVTVVGAGVVGLSCAVELADRGAEVTVLDGAGVGTGASAGNAGWVTPFLATPRAAPGAVGAAARSMLRSDGPARIHPHLEASFVRWVLRFLRASRPAEHRRGTAALQHLARTAIPSFDRLADRGIQFEQHRAGLAVVAFTSRTLSECVTLHRTMTALGYRGAAEVLRGQEVREFDPAIHRDVAGLVHLTSERHVRPESLVRGLADAVRARGAAVHEHRPVHRVRSQGAEWTVEAGGGLEIVSDAVVVAAGFASRDLLAAMGVRLPLEAARGTSLTVRGEGTAPRHPLKLADRMIACSPFDSAVRLSGTFDIGARGTEVDRRRLRAVVTQGLRYLDSWQPTGTGVEWVGHRPTTPDDLPVIGPVPRRRGLFVSTGHGTLGVTLGPTTGDLLAREIVEGSSQELLAPFRPARFTAGAL